ncbi:hypothetical protein E2C01_049640 [Portunus trituberculatus]|uniref:Uncharacterized protein n=1 Tax=Portunus trituberculatus TaxID=210409 RepID=A0A5B7GDQ2_PORTR|nr:hypothetical protein [Portunus trituberculatus]
MQQVCGRCRDTFPSHSASSLHDLPPPAPPTPPQCRRRHTTVTSLYAEKVAHVFLIRGSSLPKTPPRS